jgi:hypothetical protein
VAAGGAAKCTYGCVWSSAELGEVEAKPARARVNVFQRGGIHVGGRKAVVDCGNEYATGCKRAGQNLLLEAVTAGPVAAVNVQQRGKRRNRSGAIHAREKDRIAN